MSKPIEIQRTDIFNIDVEHKKELIQQSAELFWHQCSLTARLTGEKMGTILSKSLGNLEVRVKELQEEEEYEMCYFLNEVMWATHRMIQDKRKDEPII